MQQSLESVWTVMLCQVLLRYFSIRDFSLHEFKTRCDYRDVEQHGCTDLLYRLNPSFSIGGLFEGSNYRVDNTVKI